MPLFKVDSVLDGEINDHLQNIDVYQSLISDITTTLDSKGASYRDAIARKPSKPSWPLTNTSNKWP